MMEKGRIEILKVESGVTSGFCTPFGLGWVDGIVSTNLKINLLYKIFN